MNIAMEETAPSPWWRVQLSAEQIRASKRCPGRERGWVIFVGGRLVETVFVRA